MSQKNCEGLKKSWKTVLIMRLQVQLCIHVCLPWCWGKQKHFWVHNAVSYLYYDTNDPSSTLAFPVCLLRYLGTPRWLLVIFQTWKCLCQQMSGLEICSKFLDKNHKKSKNLEWGNLYEPCVHSRFCSISWLKKNCSWLVFWGSQVFAYPRELLLPKAKGSYGNFQKL